MEGKLKQLQATLNTLQSYKLPTQFELPPDIAKDELSTDEQKKNRYNVDPDIIQRYVQAKSIYLRQRITELMMEHVQTFDGKSFQFPPPTDLSTLEENKENENHICKKVKRSAEALASNVVLLQADYVNFCERRDEFQRMLKDIEAKNDSVTDDNMKNKKEKQDKEEIDGEINEKDMEEQEQKLNELVRKKMTLKSKLDQLKAEKRILVERHGTLNMQWGEMKDLNPKFNVEGQTLSQTLNEMKQHNENMQVTISQLKEKAAWYKSIKEAYEELGGIKILSVDNIEPKNRDNKLTTNAHRHQALLTKFLLIDKYILEVTLSPIDGTNKKQHVKDDNSLEITDAILYSMKKHESNTPNDDVTSIYSEDYTVALPFPSTCDILPIAQTLASKSGENMRFLLRETLSRLRAVEMRAEELSVLRQKYLTKILKNGHEIVCSVDEGVTVVIRMTPDCPLIMGTAYVEDIVGIGGWYEDDLKKLKETINRRVNIGDLEFVNEKPIVTLMDLLVKELKTLKKPETPHLPKKNEKKQGDMKD